MKLSRLLEQFRNRHGASRAARAGKRGNRNRCIRLGLDQLERREMLTGTWSNITNVDGEQLPLIQRTILLSDGSVLAQTGDDQATNTWIRFTISGSVAHVTSVPNSNLQRLFYTSDVLTDGRVLVLGGEYSDANTDQNDTNTGEIYDPVSNSWSSIANFPEGKLGDAPSEVLNNGTVLVGSPNDSNTYIYNPATNIWTQGPSLINGDTSSEEGWVKLADGNILTYSIQGNDPQTAERYVPSLNEWVFAGNVPVPLATNAGNSSLAPELGPSILLPDGNVFWVGATDHTAIYTPPSSATGTGTWIAGPDIPGGLGGFDDPIAIEPNGTVLFSAQTLDGTFLQPPSYFEYNPSANSISANDGPNPGVQRTAAFLNIFLVLPDGDILQSAGRPPTLYHESAGTGPQAAWAPAISSVTPNSDGTFTLTGTQLNGISEGSTYGDDAENATNFPLVQFTDAAGGSAFGRTFNWTSTGVATGTTPVSTDFTPPSNLNSDDVYQLRVIANGIASKPYLFLETGPTDQSVTLQTDPANGDYQFLVNGESVGEYAPGSFSGVVLSLDVATLKVSIRETLAGAPVTIVGNLFYNTTINIGDATGVQNILGNVLLVSPGDFNTINVSDVGDSTGRYVTLSTTSDASGNDYGTITGLAPATISYKLADTASPISITGGSGGNTFNLDGGVSTQAINLDAGAGDDTVNVNLNEAPLNIDGGGGHDQINIGNGNTVLIAAPVNVTDTGGSASVLVDDYLDTASQTVTVNNGQLTGLSPAAITWTSTATGSGGVTNLHVVAGTGSDTWDVVNTSNFGPIAGGGTTWIQTGSGSSSFPTVNVQATSGGLDVDGFSSSQSVTVGSNGKLQGISGFVDVYNSNPSGSSTLAINDSADTTARIVAISDGLISGLAPAPLYWTDNTAGTYTGGVASLRIYGGSGGNTWNIASDSPLYFGTELQTGSGQADTVNLKATSGALTIDGSNDDDTVTVGSLAPALGGTLANIIGGVIIGNISGAGTTSLTLDDSGDTQARTATLSEGSLAGIAPGSIQWFDDQAGGASSGGVTALKFLGGSGANTYTVADAGAANVATTLSTGKGNDTVNVLGSAASFTISNPGGSDHVNLGSATPGLNGTLGGFLGGIDVSGAGATTLTVDDSADISARTATLSDDGHGNGSLSGLTPSPIDWVDATGSAGGVTSLSIYGGKGGNTFNVQNTGSKSESTNLYPGTGNNTVSVTGQTGPLSLRNNGGPLGQFDFVVDTASDGSAVPAGKLSMRQAISLANGAAPVAPARISFDPTAFATAQTITLSAGELLLNANASINGPVSSAGAPLLTISGGSSSRVFDVEGGTRGIDVTLENLAIENGLASGNGPNVASAGGGLLINDAGGTVTVSDVLISGNVAQGTAAAPAEGGGIAFLVGTGTFSDDTFANNNATAPPGGTGSGGAMVIVGGNVTLITDTIADNTASGGTTSTGGGISVTGASSLTLSSDTVADNKAAVGGDVYQVSPAFVESLNSVYASSSTTATDPDFAGAVAYSDHNLVDNTAGSTGFSAGTGNLLNINAELEPLGNYGGPLPTMPPLPGSPLINAGDTGIPAESIPGLVTLIGVEQTTQGTVQDLTGNVSGVTNSAVTIGPGVIGEAIQFNGTTSAVTVADNSSLDTADFTIGGWFNVSAAPVPGTTVVLATKSNGNSNGWTLTLGSNLKPSFSLSSSSGSANATSSQALAIGIWYYITGTFNGTTATLYINGTTVGTATLSGGYTTSTSPLMHGAAPTSPTDFYAGQGNALDSAGANNGTVVGNVGYQAVVVGQAFDFSGGAGNYIALGTGPDIVGTGAFAVAVWVNTTSTGTEYIINQRDPNNANGEYVLQLNDGKVNFWTNANNTYGFNITTSETVNDGKWHHLIVAERLANGTGEVYVDGVVAAEETVAPGSATDLGSGINVYIGEDVRDGEDVGPAYGFNYSGLLEGVQIYNTALSPTQIATLQTALQAQIAGDTALPTDNVTGAIDDFAFYNTALSPAQVRGLAVTGTAGTELATTDNLTDFYAGQGNALDGAGTSNGTIVGNVSYAPGVVGQAFDFDSANSYVALGTGPDIVGTGAFTVAVWVNTTSTGTEYIINQRDPINANGEYAVQLNNGQVNFWTNANNTYGFNVTTSETVNDGTWHLIVAERLANGTGEIFIDGVLAAEETVAPGSATNLESFVSVYIGEDVRDAVDVGPAYGFNYSGLLEGVQIYNTALTPTQIANLQTSLATQITATSDERGDLRRVSGGLDIGADEYQYNLVVTGNAPVSVPSNNLITYSVTVTNDGPDPVSGATLVDIPPPYVLFSIASPPGWTVSDPAGGLITLTDSSTLPSGGSAQFTLTGSVESGALNYAYIYNSVTVGPSTEDAKSASTNPDIHDGRPQRTRPAGSADDRHRRPSDQPDRAERRG